MFDLATIVRRNELAYQEYLNRTQPEEPTREIVDIPAQLRTPSNYWSRRD